MGKIKKFFGENFSSNFKMKIIFAKNAFGGHYAEKILILIQYTHQIYSHAYFFYMYDSKKQQLNCQFTYDRERHIEACKEKQIEKYGTPTNGKLINTLRSENSV